ncbi:hypothetical protein VTI74DRAFT_1972 [Chaetomium olivicolor]
MPHDGWREFLPYIISLWKTGTASVTQEGLVSYYRRHPHGACSGGTTTGNTANQLQFEYDPSSLLRDRVFYTALLTSPAEVTVTIGGVTQQGRWDQEPDGGVDLYHGSVPMNGANRQPTISATCPTGLSNYNPWVGSARGPAIGALGVANPPNVTSTPGYPLPGKSASFRVLCSFACNHGYCPDTVCGYEPNEGVIPTTSPSLPSACTSGTAIESQSAAFQGLCDFSCHFGFCPRHICRCTGTGALIDRPPKVDGKGYFLDKSVDDRGLCNFACTHGYCPGVCGNSTVRALITTVTLATGIWGSPTVQCQPPCILVLPSSTLSSATTIVIPPYTTSLEYGWTTTRTVGGTVTRVYRSTTITTTIRMPAVATSVIGFSNVWITSTTNVPSVIFGMPSVSPAPFKITPAAPPGVTASPEPRTIRPPPWPFGQDTPKGDDDEGDNNEVLLPYPYYPDDLPWFTEVPTKTLSWFTDFILEPTTTQVEGTPVPVLPCWAWFVWFCPPNIGGLVLRDFHRPGIYPPCIEAQPRPRLNK